MTALTPPSTNRPSLSPAAVALRLQRIFARLQEGVSYKDVAAEEGLLRERLRQIVHEATARRKEPPDHNQMQFARLEPALRLAARGVADGDVKSIPCCLNSSTGSTAIAIRAHSTIRPCFSTWLRGGAPQAGNSTAGLSDAQTP